MTDLQEIGVRKIVAYTEESLIEGGKAAATPLRMFGVAAVLRNPWAGQAFEDNLKPEILRIAPVLGKALTDRIVALAGEAAVIEAYGKAAVVGIDGEIEHASALIHTLHFGNFYRKAVGAKSYLSFTNVRGGPNCSIAIPMMHKDDEGKRSHYLTLQFAINDAPGPNEIVVALGASIGGRPHHRIGDRYQDLAALGSNETV